MQTEESRTDLGAVRIHKKVIASIASLATLEIDGVRRVGGDLKSGIFELIGRKSHSAIKVEFTRSEEVKVDIPIVIKYGYNIPEVASRAQESVRAALEKMTNLSIRDININVQSIERG